MTSGMSKCSVVFICLVLVCFLPTCAPKGVMIPPGSDTLNPCPAREIRVEELESIGAPGCNLQGSTIVFPDGKLMPVVAVGEVWSAGIYTENETSDDKYHVTNWGVPGIAASIREESGAYKTWATSDAARKLQDQ